MLFWRPKAIQKVYEMESMIGLQFALLGIILYH